MKKRDSAWYTGAVRMGVRLGTRQPDLAANTPKRPLDQGLRESLCAAMFPA